MARIVVIGGGVGGLTSAMLLARDGHDVTVLERDAAEPPSTADAAWTGWDRRGVNQFKMVHLFAPRFRALLEAELPDVVEEIDALGGIRYNPMRLVPDEMIGGYRDSDDQYEMLSARRPVMEAALARTSARTPRLEVRRGVAVTELLTDGAAANGVPNVVGLRTETGEELRADLVVDAAGRRSSLPAMLASIGARAPEEELEDSGFMYFGRHFRSADGQIPPLICGILMPWGTVSTLTLPADNGTWGLGIITSAKDAALRGLKDVDTWMRTWRSFPLVAHWLEGEPLDDQVAIMAKIEDRHRSFVVDGAPVATGVLAVADAWACTNPSLGRGASIAFMHAVALRDLMRVASIDFPMELAQRWHEVTEATVEPYYRATLDFDRHRLAEIEAGIDGKAYDPGDPQYEMAQALAAAAGKDPDLFRAFLNIAGVLQCPDEVFAAPGVFEKVVELGASWRDEPVFAPTREELLAIVAG
ncbi:MAG TPA: FAD-dependent oxidoreductase [Acidimicrobiia bacterium]|nr:FAD-dependent oxidoreductase [Acidimicrobiia bacterium]